MTATSSSTRWRSASPRRTRYFTRKATGVGNPIVYLGSKTGRDGIHGATMASASFEADAEEKRPTVQVGDPFAEKLLARGLSRTDGVRRGRRHPGYGRGGAHLVGGRDGGQGRSRRRTRSRPRAVPRDGHERLRDDALREPRTHADGPQAREGSASGRDLPQMGARFRRHRQDDRFQAFRRQARRRGQGGPADQGTRRRSAAL